MNVGQVYLYKSDRPVLITGGHLHGTHGLSNYWRFKVVLKDGTLGHEGGDYDDEPGKFRPLIGAKVQTVVTLPPLVPCEYAGCAVKFYSKTSGCAADCHCDKHSSTESHMRYCKGRVEVAS